MNYYEKYIKYKTKYFKLKNLIGGTSKNIIIVATHSYRLQCILNGMRKISKQFQEHPEQYKYIKRFKNCAIVRIFRNLEYICVQLIYQGIYDEYNDETDDTHYELGDIHTFKLEINITQYPTYSIPPNVEIFLIRHGEGIHNVISKEEKEKLKENPINNKVLFVKQNLKDARLTDKGNKQAFIAGHKLNTYLNNNFKTFNNNYYFCASDLYRTQETIGNIKYVLNKSIKGKFRDPIYIISCIHEITPHIREVNATEHDCDNPGKIVKETSIYNMPKCIGNNLKCNSISKKIRQISYTTYIDWSKYKQRNICSNTSDITSNIIKEILSVISK